MEFKFKPELKHYTTFIRYANTVINSIIHTTNHEFIDLVVTLRHKLEISKNSLLSNEEIKLLISKSLFLDLIAQGWNVQIINNEIILSHKENTESQNEIKENIRKSHLIQRDSQLANRSVRDFIKKMEKKRLTKKGWFSIFSLMRDGKDLSAKLMSASKIKDPEKKINYMGNIIEPYIQFVEKGEVCSITGIPLMDIWRYFRHTWVTPYKVLPGRSMYILIRDAATPTHTVIGIAALGSAVAQHSVRDKWIGWDSNTFYNNLLKTPKVVTIRHLKNSLETMIQNIYIQDLKKLHITKRDFKNPSDNIINKLKKLSLIEIRKHRLHPNKKAFNNIKLGPTEKKVKWASYAETHLFNSKRYHLLSSLLKIKKVLLKHKLFSIKRASHLKNILEISEVQNAIEQLIRKIKGEKVGINIMDIVICGAVAPYNPILGGKLVCMLLASPEVSKYYKTKYNNRQSIIASSMRGKPARKEQDLIYLGTTSLYGVGSSQYNRIKIPAEDIDGKKGNVIEYKNLGLSAGFGSFHFSQTTLDFMKLLLARKQDGKRVNSIFGEGANPLMRKIRESLDILKLPSEKILNHGFKRVVYGIPLASNLREVLIGLQRTPSYIIPQSKSKEKTQLIVKYWYKRWLINRINDQNVLEMVREHSLIYPIKHGARVNLKKDENEINLI